MKRVFNKITILAVVAVATIALSGCSDKDGVCNDNRLNGIIVTHGPLDEATGKYRCDFEEGDATFVEKGSEVKPLTEDTEVRFWHYQNSEEYVCVLKGNAVILENR